jgi:hypothetical protein
MSIMIPFTMKYHANIKDQPNHAYGAAHAQLSRATNRFKGRLCVDSISRSALNSVLRFNAISDCNYLITLMKHLFYRYFKTSILYSFLS